jgi:AmiR/NasT family two-component response regulator
MAGRWGGPCGLAEQQLRVALQSRIAVEKATGALAQRDTVTINEALMRLRARAHATQQTLADVAQAILGEAPPEA